MTTLVQTLVSGILVGGLYGLFSSGLTLIFGITRVINFAHGDFVTLGGCTGGRYCCSRARGGSAR